MTENVRMSGNLRDDAEWDSIKRVRSALLHQESDRVPFDVGGTRVSPIHVKAYHEYRRRLGMPPSDPSWQIRYLQQPRIDADFRDWLEVDLESVDPDTRNVEREVEDDPERQHYVDMWGCEWMMPEGATACVVHRAPLAAVESIADVERYPWPRGDHPAVLANIETDTRKIWHNHLRAVVLGRTFVGTLEMINYLCGMQKAMTDLATNPALIEAMMDRIVEHKLQFYRAAIQRALGAGIDYLIVNESEDLGSQNSLLISPDMYRRILKPRHAQVFNAIKEYSKGRAFIHLHSDGAIRKLIPDLIEIGVEILNPIQANCVGMEPSELKRDFGDVLVFHGGGVDTQTTLPYGSPEEVKDEVRCRIEELAPGGGFIFAPVHIVQHDVPFANFIAMLEAYAEYT